MPIILGMWKGILFWWIWIVEAVVIGIVLAVLLFMVLMGMENRHETHFEMFGYKTGAISAAIMFFIFLCGGVLVGVVLAIGAGRSGK